MKGFGIKYLWTKWSGSFLWAHSKRLAAAAVSSISCLSAYLTDTKFSAPYCLQYEQKFQLPGKYADFFQQISFIPAKFLFQDLHPNYLGLIKSTIPWFVIVTITIVLISKLALFGTISLLIFSSMELLSSQQGSLGRNFLVSSKPLFHKDLFFVIQPLVWSVFWNTYLVSFVKIELQYIFVSIVCCQLLQLIVYNLLFVLIS